MLLVRVRHDESPRGAEVTTMLERAARALALSYYEEDKWDNPSAYLIETPEQVTDWAWDQWITQARAVLMAVRGEAVSVAMKVYDQRDVGIEADDFTAMIDAILQEEK